MRAHQGPLTQVALTMQVEAVNRVQADQPGVEGLLCMLTAELAGSAPAEVDGVVVGHQREIACDQCSMSFQSLVPAKPRSRTQVELTWPASIAICASSGSASSRDSSSGAMGGERPKVAIYVDAGDGAAPKPVLIKFAQPAERADTVVAKAKALTRDVSTLFRKNA